MSLLNNITKIVRGSRPARPVTSSPPLTISRTGTPPRVAGETLGRVPRIDRLSDAAIDRSRARCEQIDRVRRIGSAGPRERALARSLGDTWVAIQELRLDVAEVEATTR